MPPNLDIDYDSNITKRTLIIEEFKFNIPVCLSAHYLGTGRAIASKFLGVTPRRPGDGLSDKNLGY